MIHKYVEIAVNVPRVAGVFHYHVPAALAEQLQPGHLVAVPFGEQIVQGVVLRAIREPEVHETRPVLALLDDAVTVTASQIALAEQIAARTLAPLAACIALMLPRGLSKMGDMRYSLTDVPPPAGELNQTQSMIVEMLQARGPLHGRQINRKLSRRNWQTAANRMVKQGWLAREPVLPPPSVRPKYIRTAQLAVPPEIVLAKPEGLSADRFPEVKARRQKALEFLVRESGPVDVAWVYAESGCNLADLKMLHEIDLIILSEQEAWRDPLAGLSYDLSAPLPLTRDQQRVWDVIEDGLAAAAAGRTSKPVLLHGVTGSGKTEIYLRAIAETLEHGKQVIMLVPEIALTPQTVRRLMGRFPGRVGLLHSQLSEGEVYDTWRRARRGALSIIVGPRSALFAPLPDLGLLVLDECHDDSYFQDTNPPYYHARQAAVDYAQQLGIPIILGSATPDITSLYQARQDRWQYLELPQRILAHVETVNAYQQKLGQTSHYQTGEAQTQMAALPPVEVVDMRQELKLGNRGLFSQALQDALGQVLANDQQAILFLNRRGTATYIFCRDCGHALACPKCDTNLTFHISAQQRSDTLLCHHCGYQRRRPKTCPECGSERIRHYGTGTERVEAEVNQLFPEARTLRWDYETTREKGAHELILSHFTNQRADVLIGTQMLSKGLDLPLVTLVGVVLADVGLHLPDYRAGERVFQTLAQVAGRAGRSPLGGQVILQTFEPEHYIIQAAAKHDYAAFSQQELDYRRKLRYPPYSQLVRLEYRHANAHQAEQTAHQLAGQMRQWIKTEKRGGTRLIGPAPCFYTRLDGEYRWHILLSGPDPASLLANRQLTAWRVQVNPTSLL